jgi:hypothetical protein
MSLSFQHVQLGAGQTDDQGCGRNLVINRFAKKIHAVVCSPLFTGWTLKIILFKCECNLYYPLSACVGRGCRYMTGHKVLTCSLSNSKIVTGPQHLLLLFSVTQDVTVFVTSNTGVLTEVSSIIVFSFL